MDRLFIRSIDLISRHEGHEEESNDIIPVAHHDSSHYANVKYGYILLFISIVGMILISILNSINLKKREISVRSINFGILLRKPSIIVILVVWMGILIFLTLIGGSSSSLNGLAKRFGRVTFGTIPLVLFLSLRPSPLPNTYYIRLLSLHKWVSRITVLFGSIHGILYLVYFIKQGTTKKLLKVDNFLGLIILFGFLLVFITSLGPIRKRSFELFHAIHYPLAWTFLLLGLFHARPGVSFLVLWSFFILAGQALYRIFTSRTVKILDYYQISPTLYSVTFPRDIMPDYFPIGSHIRINKGSLLSPLSWIKSTHPYTISSVSSDDSIRLVIRQTNFSIEKHLSYTISGPFASTINQEVISNNNKDEGPEYTSVNTIDGVKKVIIFAGGSGISFASPLVRELDTIGIPYKFIWITKDKSDLKVLDLLNIEDVDVFITGNNTTNKYSDIIEGAESIKPDNSNFEESIEFDELLDDDDDELSTPEETDQYKQSASKINITYGRPDFNQCIEDFILPGQEHLSWAISCGPRILVKDVESWASRKKIQFSGEKYSL